MIVVHLPQRGRHAGHEAALQKRKNTQSSSNGATRRLWFFAELIGSRAPRRTRPPGFWKGSRPGSAGDLINLLPSTPQRFVSADYNAREVSKVLSLLLRRAVLALVSRVSVCWGEEIRQSQRVAARVKRGCCCQSRVLRLMGANKAGYVREKGKQRVFWKGLSWSLVWTDGARTVDCLSQTRGGVDEETHNYKRLAQEEQKDTRRLRDGVCH